MRLTVASLARMKRDGERIAMLTAYDYGFARAADAAGVDAVLVGDSLGNVVQGHDSTLPVTLEDMLYHGRAVGRALQRALLILDLPFLSYQESPRQALRSAGAALKANAAQVVKIEGGAEMAPTVRFLTARGVPVCAHLGLTPQSVHALGGYRVQGREPDAAARLRSDALALQDAGASLLVLEAIPRALAAEVTASLHIPTIGIGAGAQCDGQVLVMHDLLGLTASPPRFVRNFMTGAPDIQGAFAAYVQAVKDGSFPAAEHGYD